jgi:hypothetical protein
MHTWGSGRRPACHKDDDGDDETDADLWQEIWSDGGRSRMDHESGTDGKSGMDRNMLSHHALPLYVYIPTDHWCYI